MSVRASERFVGNQENESCENTEKTQEPYSLISGRVIEGLVDCQGQRGVLPLKMSSQDDSCTEFAHTSCERQEGSSNNA